MISMCKSTTTCYFRLHRANLASNILSRVLNGLAKLSFKNNAGLDSFLSATASSNLSYKSSSPWPAFAVSYLVGPSYYLYRLLSSSLGFPSKTLWAGRIKPGVRLLVGGFGFFPCINR
jgi:hypothetical protein